MSEPTKDGEGWLKWDEVPQDIREVVLWDLHEEMQETEEMMLTALELGLPAQEARQAKIMEAQRLAITILEDLAEDIIDAPPESLRCRVCGCEAEGNIFLSSPTLCVKCDAEPAIPLAETGEARCGACGRMFMTATCNPQSAVPGVDYFCGRCDDNGQAAANGKYVGKPPHAAAGRKPE